MKSAGPAETMTSAGSSPELANETSSSFRISTEPPTSTSTEVWASEILTRPVTGVTITSDPLWRCGGMLAPTGTRTRTRPTWGPSCVPPKTTVTVGVFSPGG